MEALTVQDLKSKSFAKRIGAKKTTFKVGKKTPFRRFEMKIYPKREYLTFGNSPKKTPRIIYLMGEYAESDDFRGFKNPVSRIRMSLDNFLRHGKTIYDTGGYQLVGEPECEPIIELFYEILTDVVARMDAVFGILNNTSWDNENRDYNKWNSRNYIRGLSLPPYQEMALEETKKQFEKIEGGQT